MNISYIPEDLITIGKYKVVSFENNVLVIDNFYKNYEELYKILKTIPLPRWQFAKGTKNFKEYYDCRPVLHVPYFDRKNIILRYEKVYSYLLKRFFNYDKIIEISTDLLEFNFYKNIKKGVSNKMQFAPHKDWAYNCIVYMDKVSSGGTVIYNDLSESDYNNIGKGQHDNYKLRDMSAFSKTLIPAKPNRLVIFPGSVYHSSYIDNHNKYTKNWRMNHIIQIRY
jgi:hypothetical protein|tara:strand:+ start:545 stop:1216 length:672 start_codon:yes stop_codon:yes gene_type:complete